MAPSPCLLMTALANKLWWYLKERALLHLRAPSLPHTSLFNSIIVCKLDKHYAWVLLSLHIIFSLWVIGRIIKWSGKTGKNRQICKCVDTDLTVWDSLCLYTGESMCYLFIVMFNEHKWSEVLKNSEHYLLHQSFRHDYLNTIPHLQEKKVQHMKRLHNSIQKNYSWSF